MIDNSISILGQVISIILGMFSTYIVLNFMHNFKRNVFYKKYVYIIVYIVFTLLIFLSSMYFTGAMRMLTNVLLTIIVGHLFFNREKVYIFYYALFIFSNVLFASYFISIISIYDLFIKHSLL